MTSPMMTAVPMAREVFTSLVVGRLWSRRGVQGEAFQVVHFFTTTILLSRSPMIATSPKLVKLQHALFLPPFAVTLTLLQLPLSTLHRGEWITGGNASALALFPTQVLIAPDIFLLKAGKDKKSLLFIWLCRFGMLVGSIPWIFHTILEACCVGEAHGNLVLFALALLRLLSFEFSILLCLSDILLIRCGDKLKMASVIMQRCILTPIAPALLFMARFDACFSIFPRIPYITVRIVFTPEPPALTLTCSYVTICIAAPLCVIACRWRRMRYIRDIACCCC
jgi:hypothetical protein